MNDQGAIGARLLQGVPMACAAVAAAFLCGCANDQQRTRAEGVGAGVAVGAVLGGIVGGRGGALAGAAIGGVVGGAAGNQVAEKKRLYAEREDALNAAAAQSQAIAQQTRAANDVLQRDIAGLEASVARLRERRMSAAVRRDLALSARRSFEEANNKLDQQLAAVRGEIGRQQALLRREQALAQQTKEPSPPTAVRLVGAGVDDLRSQERALERAKAQLKLLDSKRAF